jgi:hypothetical protein
MHTLKKTLFDFLYKRSLRMLVLILTMRGTCVISPSTYEDNTSPRKCGILTNPRRSEDGTSTNVSRRVSHPTVSALAHVYDTHSLIVGRLRTVCQ